MFIDKRDGSGSYLQLCSHYIVVIRDVKYLQVKDSIDMLNLFVKIRLEFFDVQCFF